MGNETFDELLKRDEQRVADGFKKKIKLKRVLVGHDKVLTVPYVEEEKLLHGDFEPTGEHGEDEAGRGEGEIGDIIARSRPQGGGGDSGDDEDDDSSDAGEGNGGEHGLESDIFQLGKELTEKLKLPNLKDKGKKVPTDDYIYDLTDRHRGSGQFLDRKETLKSIIKSNVALGLVSGDNVDPSKLAIGPHDYIFRVLSKEKVWKSPAVVFFMRDYSRSMYGAPTKAVVDQHLMIYSWLMVQHEKLVIPRFIVHNAEAKEVPAHRYFGANSSGGTFIPSGYSKIMEIIVEENLARNYNLYLFQGTDGEDDDDGQVAIPWVKKLLEFFNRIGVSVLNTFRGEQKTVFEKYIAEGGFLDQKDLFRMHVMSSKNPSETDNQEAVKALIAQD
ncbi:MAG: DUF444 family protein [bacterium]|nr:DUF444 family protein [bacterium]